NRSSSASVRHAIRPPRSVTTTYRRAYGCAGLIPQTYVALYNGFVKWAGSSGRRSLRGFGRQIVHREHLHNLEAPLPHRQGEAHGLPPLAPQEPLAEGCRDRHRNLVPVLLAAFDELAQGESVSLLLLRVEVLHRDAGPEPDAVTRDIVLRNGGQLRQAPAEMRQAGLRELLPLERRFVLGVLA